MFRPNKLTKGSKRITFSLLLLFALCWIVWGQTRPVQQPAFLPQQAKVPIESPPKRQASSSSTPVVVKAPSPVKVQQSSGQTPSQHQNTADKKTSKVYLEKSDKLVYDQFVSPDYQVLIGNVCFRHDGTFLYCDSAYFYDKSNSLDAFSNVRIEQGDTLFIFGDKLFYNGDEKLAKLRENVRMENRSVVLFTDSFNYNRRINIGYYFDGGLMIDGENELSSVYGEYKPDTKMAHFKTDVKLTDPDFTLYSDTLKYNTQTKIATILGPSRIISEDNFIYTERGWYNTKDEKSMLLDNSYVENKDKRLIGDTIFYDRKKKFGEAWSHVHIKDSTNKISLKGHYGKYYEKEKRAFVTDSALCLEYSSQDTLFLHADSIFMHPEPLLKDSLGKEIPDSLDHKRIQAYHGVRFWRIDLQGVCDSLIYLSRDSVIQMHVEPMVWSDNFQLNGAYINVHLKDSAVDRIRIIDRAFGIEQIDSISFNQLSGKKMTGYIRNNELRHLFVDGNAESLYYIFESDSTLIGLNKTESSFMDIYTQNKKLYKLVLTPSSKGVMTPPDKLTDADRRLSGFIWEQKLRPLSKTDVFTRYEKEKITSDQPKKKRKGIRR